MDGGRDTTGRFTGRAEAYARYRERFEASWILPPLETWCGLTPEWVIADVGAGTGMLAEVFLRNGNAVIAVEPNAEMRAMGAELSAREPRLRMVDGRAEATGLGDESVEMIAVGRALHWFDLARSMEEFRRVLRPGGWVTVVSLSRRDDGSAENCALEQLLRYATPEGLATRASYAVYTRLREMFGGGEFYTQETSGELRLGWEELLGLAMSLSHAPLATDPDFEKFELGLRGLYERFAKDGRVTLETEQRIAAGRFAG